MAKPDLTGLYAPGSTCVGTQFGDLVRADLSSANCSNANFIGEQSYSKFDNAVLYQATGNVPKVQNTQTLAAQQSENQAAVQQQAVVVTNPRSGGMRMGMG